ncbi:MAG: glycerol-3-phosphate dehydrogenase/oxidase [Planctomycetota bacterium]|nr:glycerol-3-phosphate dehydrogenase/oxidase [Planctomycetota bacterium]MDP6942436.1 glycerol-3-phosphate dehydrogenase/oxidase [Planctomycetota bacterium]
MIDSCGTMVGWSAKSRGQDLDRLASQEWDLLVVGGGITGCGIALDAASRGLKVALVEKNDFSSGTSSRSSKLIHGGLRYLKQGQIQTTLESSREKALLRKLAPHLVRDLPFMFPISGGWKQRLVVGFGLWIYDCLAGFPRGLRHKVLSPKMVQDLLPGLSKKYQGALLYYDAKADDARLTIHVAKRAVMEGAVLLNHVELEQFALKESKVVGGTVCDSISGKKYSIRSKLTINATGVWCDETRKRTLGSPEKLVQASQGSHLVIPHERLPVRYAITLGEPGSSRLIFLIPWEGRTLIGTTDEFYDGSLENPQATESELDSLLSQANAALPKINLTRKDIVGTFAGLRPLARSEHKDSSKASREERIYEGKTGLISILGGKLTTYRQMAENVVDLAVKKLGLPSTKSQTKSLSLFGASVSNNPIESSFGSEAKRVRAIMEENPKWAEPLVLGQAPTYAEAIYALRFERAVTLSDILLRRTRLGVLDWEKTQDSALEIATNLAMEAGWNPESELELLREERP